MSDLPFNFLFRKSELDRTALAQGDVIARTDAVADCLGQAHRHYPQAPECTHLVVLTQSCDLVKRGGAFRAPCITLAMARPFGNAVREFLQESSKTLKGTRYRYHTGTQIGKLRNRLERFINNTEDEYFFLPGGHPRLSGDLLVHLRLTVALHRDHYDILAQAKVAEIKDVFRAKLGWLKGQIFSQVATPDAGESAEDTAAVKSNFYEKYLPRNRTPVLTSVQADLLRAKVREERAHLDGERELTSSETQRLVKQGIPDDATIIARNIAEKLKNTRIIDAADHARVARIIANETSFKSFVKSCDA